MLSDQYEKYLGVFRIWYMEVKMDGDRIHSYKYGAG